MSEIIEVLRGTPKKYELFDYVKKWDTLCTKLQNFDSYFIVDLRGKSVIYRAFL